MSEKQLRILIIDDSPEDRELYRRLIQKGEKFQCDLLETDSGEEGLHLCETEKLDCILLDYRVPDLDGLQFLEELTKLVQQGRLPFIPLIMVTGQGDESTAVQAMKGGAQDYLIKGRMTSDDLRRAIHNAVEKGSLHRKIEEQKAELERSQRLLEEKHKELEQFAYVASHDLQEPLRMVASYLQLLERRYKGKLDAEADKFIGYAVDGATRMKALIRDLLSLSRVETRGQEFRPIPCETILTHSLANLQLAIKESEAEITHDSLPTVMADETQIGQLLQNLIANAIKFRGEQAPRVHVTAKQEGKEWLISVRDNGIGFDPEFAERIFVIFQRLHGKGDYPGTGIGLAVCKKIVQRHGGRIWAESEAGKGATFYFSLPAAPKKAERPATGAEPARTKPETVSG